MKLGKADSLGRRKGFLLLFTFLGSEGRGEEEAAVVILGWGMERCITVNSSYLGAQDLPSPVPTLKDNCRKQCPAQYTLCSFREVLLSTRCH